MNKICLDSVAEAMEHGWLVNWTIARYIIGADKWDKEVEHKKYIVEVRNIIHENQLMKSVFSS